MALKMAKMAKIAIFFTPKVPLRAIGEKVKKKNYPKSGHPEEIYILSGFFYPVLDILATLGHFLKTPSCSEVCAIKG